MVEGKEVLLDVFSLTCIFKIELSDGVITAINTLKEETIQDI